MTIFEFWVGLGGLAIPLIAAGVAFWYRTGRVVEMVEQLRYDQREGFTEITTHLDRLNGGHLEHEGRIAHLEGQGSRGPSLGD